MCKCCYYLRICIVCRNSKGILYVKCILIIKDEKIFYIVFIFFLNILDNLKFYRIVILLLFFRFNKF